MSTSAAATRTALAATVALAVAGVGLRAVADPDPAPDDEPAPAAAAGSSDSAGAPVPRKFNHAAHESRGLQVAEHCENCHEPDARGELIPVGKHAHQPCLDSDCHVKDFLSVGALQDVASERYQKAAGFCMGCHLGRDGLAPGNYEKAAADNAFRNNDDPGFHVDFEHFKHTERARCRDCHLVEPLTFELKLETPGHHECAKCHASNAAPPMTACGNCHKDPGPRQYFEDRRKDTAVTSCNSDDHRRRSKGGKTVACFTHERAEHREKEGGRRVQCDTCHNVISETGNREKYRWVRDIKAKPIIGNADQAHKQCGQCHPHNRDVRPDSGNCTRCHANKMRSVFE